MRFLDTLTTAQVERLEALRERDREERAATGVRNKDRVKALAPPVAELLCFFVVSRNARTIVEFGTSHGYSTIHLAAAAERTNGHVHSVDVKARKTAHARANLEEAGLLHRVTLVTARAADFAAQLPDAVDLVLADCGVKAFLPAFKHVRRKMAPGCLLFIDGDPRGDWNAGAGYAFRALLEGDASFLVLPLPMHREELLAVYLPDETNESA